MKRLFLSVAIALFAFSLFGVGYGAKSASAAWEGEQIVRKGVLDDLVPIGHAGGSYGNAAEYGSALIAVPERGINRGIWELSLGGGWGSRYSYDYAVDLDDFEITLDLSRVSTDGSQIALIFGAHIGDYLNAENGGLGVKVCRHNNQYGVVISNQSHTRTIEEIVPAPAVFPWDSQNSGYCVTAGDGILTISFLRTSDDYTLKINSDEYSVPLSAVTDTLGENTGNVYFALGSVSDATEIVRVVSLKEKNSAEYDATVPAIAETIDRYVRAAAAGPDTPEKIVETETLGENSGYDKLLRHDKKYFENAIAGAAEKIAAARLALNTDGKIALLKADTDKLKGMIDGAADNAGLASAENYAVTVKEKDIDALGTPGGEYKQAFDNAVKEYEAVIATIGAARKRIVEGYFDAFGKLSESIGNVEDLKKVEKCRADINVNLPKLSQEDKTELAMKLVSVQEKVDKLGSLPGWSKTDNELTFNGGDHFGFSSVSRSGSITYEKKFKVNDISFGIGEITGSEGWLAISLSRNQEPFTDSSVEAMQANPSLVFMIHSLGKNKIGVEVFLIKSTHTSLFSATRGNMIVTLKEGEKLTIEVKADDDNNATYANIRICGEKFTGTPVKNSELKGAVGSDFTGYLSLVKLGDMSVRVDRINGKNATSDKIADLSAPDEPISGEESGADTPESVSGATDTGKKSCRSALSGGELAFLAALAAGGALIGKKKKKQIG